MSDSKKRKLESMSAAPSSAAGKGDRAPETVAAKVSPLKASHLVQRPAFFTVLLFGPQAKRLVAALIECQPPLEAIPVVKKLVKGMLEICKHGKTSSFAPKLYSYNVYAVTLFLLKIVSNLNLSLFVWLFSSYLAEDNVDDAADAHVIEAVVMKLKALHGDSEQGDHATNAMQMPKTPGVEEVERDICFILGLMAIKTEHQAVICDMNALPTLVAIIKRYATLASATGTLAGSSSQTCRRAADAITNLAHENNSIKTRVRQEGGIPPLVSLLKTMDPKVQRAVAGTLRTLAFKNEENKILIVGQGALRTLIQMLYSEDTSIHYEAVGVIGNLVHSSQNIKHRVLEEGALQAVINLLSSPCPDSQREAALLLGQFATAEGDYKVKIVQRGAVAPLIDMLSAHDPQLKEMAAFALGRLAQNMDNQAGIMAAGGLPPLLELLSSTLSNLQHNAAFALYGLSENEDNVLHFVRNGALQRILDCELGPQASRDCIQKMTKRLQDRLGGRVLCEVLYVLQSVDDAAKRNLAIALGMLASPDAPSPHDLRVIMITRGGALQVLLDILADEKVPSVTQRQAARALHTVAEACGATDPIQTHAAPIAPAEPRVYLGTQYVNNKTLSDVIFVVEGKEFFAHRIALLSSSEIFRSMFDGNYREREAATIPIPNIRLEVFQAMMECVYTGTVEVRPELAQELLEAADQYMLDGLKRLCEATIAGQLSAENVTAAFDLGEDLNAPELAKRCALYCLENYEEMAEICCKDENNNTSKVEGFARLISKMLPRLRESLEKKLVSRADGYLDGVDSDGMGDVAME